MGKRRLIDTNLIVRHLVQDDVKHAKMADKLFAACDRGELVLVILPAVLSECIFVLDSFYGHPRARIAQALGQLIGSPGIDIERLPTHLDALDRYQQGSAHFIDCLIAAHAVADDLAVATFDRDFRKFPDVRVEIA